jgi:hypothetical protein
MGFRRRRRGAQLLVAGVKLQIVMSRPDLMTFWQQLGFGALFISSQQHDLNIARRANREV